MFRFDPLTINTTKLINRLERWARWGGVVTDYRAGCWIVERQHLARNSHITCSWTDIPTKDAAVGVVANPSIQIGPSLYLNVAYSTIDHPERMTEEAQHNQQLVEREKLLQLCRKQQNWSIITMALGLAVTIGINLAQTHGSLRAAAELVTFLMIVLMYMGLRTNLVGNNNHQYIISTFKTTDGVIYFVQIDLTKIANADADAIKYTALIVLHPLGEVQNIFTQPDQILIRFQSHDKNDVALQKLLTDQLGYPKSVRVQSLFDFNSSVMV